MDPRGHKRNMGITSPDGFVRGRDGGCFDFAIFYRTINVKTMGELIFEMSILEISRVLEWMSDNGKNDLSKSPNEIVQAFYDERARIRDAEQGPVYPTSREFILHELDKLEAKPTEPEYNYGGPDDELSKNGREIILRLSRRVAELEESKKRQDAVAHHYHSLWISERERADFNQKALEAHRADYKALELEVKELNQDVSDWKRLYNDLQSIARNLMETVHRQAQSLPIHTPKPTGGPVKK
jgi:hypothetical protein